MIRAYYGIQDDPFSRSDCTLLPQQQEVYDTLRVHSQQGGLCLVLGVPGTGKSILKSAITERTDKKTVVATVTRTLHTYANTLKMLCQAFGIEFAGSNFQCEKALIEQAISLNRQGKMLVTIIDDAHLLEMDTLRRLRLLFEDFPKNYNVILIGQPCLLTNMSLTVNEDLKSRVTYSTIMRRISPDEMEEFILAQLDRVGLAHNLFTEDALKLIVRSSEGILRRARNLCVSCMLEGLRSRKKTIDLDNVNRVLLQPHWRKEQDITEY